MHLGRRGLTGRVKKSNAPWSGMAGCWIDNISGGARPRQKQGQRMGQKHRNWRVSARFRYGDVRTVGRLYCAPAGSNQKRNVNDMRRIKALVQNQSLKMQATWAERGCIIQNGSRNEDATQSETGRRRCETLVPVRDLVTCDATWSEPS
jgi:hypothetical protein